MTAIHFDGSLCIPLKLLLSGEGFFRNSAWPIWSDLFLSTLLYCGTHWEGGISGVRAYHLTFIYLLLSILFFDCTISITKLQCIYDFASVVNSDRSKKFQLLAENSEPITYFKIQRWAKEEVDFLLFWGNDMHVCFHRLFSLATT